MYIRTATLKDLTALYKIESQCFPKQEAATKTTLKNRLQSYPQHFWVLEDDNTIIGFINGPVTDEPDLTDEMYKDTDVHTDKGAWQMIFGVDVIPEYRRQGNGGRLINQAIKAAKDQGRLGLVLTCKKQLIPYYEKFGFVSQGLSLSSHGNATWYQMKLIF